jgi:hypothetical protein
LLLSNISRGKKRRIQGGIKLPDNRNKSSFENVEFSKVQDAGQCPQAAC